MEKLNPIQEMLGMGERHISETDVQNVYNKLYELTRTSSNYDFFGNINEVMGTDYTEDEIKEIYDAIKNKYPNGSIFIYEATDDTKLETTYVGIRLNRINPVNQKIPVYWNSNIFEN